MKNQIERIYSAELTEEDKKQGLKGLVNTAIQHYKTTKEYLESDNKQWYENCERYCLVEGLKQLFN